MRIGPVELMIICSGMLLILAATATVYMIRRRRDK
jgi:hypothetical protein